MTLDGGKGDVIVTTKGTVLADSLSEKMVAITGNNHNIWLILHRGDTSVFLSYEITSFGINATPVISSTGTLSSPLGYVRGVLKTSHNRRKIVAISTFVSFRTR